jgi:hypothetical protein
MAIPGTHGFYRHGPCATGRKRRFSKAQRIANAMARRRNMDVKAIHGEDNPWRRQSMARNYDRKRKERELKNSL